MGKMYQLSKAAELDWRNIAAYTFKKFGKGQLQKYTDSLLKCIDDLVIEKGQIKKLTISEHTILIYRCQKHFIFAQNELNKPVVIIAILHQQWI